MVDPVSRSAAKLAALVAVPVALLAGVVFVTLLGAAPDDPPPPPEPSTSGPPAPVATGPVTMAAPALDERAELVCRALLSQLPAELDGMAQRPVTEGAEQNTAYGDPPVRLACGAPPAEHPPTARLWVLSRVCWYAAEQPDATVWTTVDREVPVRVTVPASYQGQQVIGFSPAIIGSIRSIDNPPSGCG